MQDKHIHVECKTLMQLTKAHNMLKWIAEMCLYNFAWVGEGGGGVQESDQLYFFWLTIITLQQLSV